MEEDKAKKLFGTYKKKDLKKLKNEGEGLQFIELPSLEFKIKKFSNYKISVELVTRNESEFLGKKEIRYRGKIGFTFYKKAWKLNLPAKSCEVWSNLNSETDLKKDINSELSQKRIMLTEAEMQKIVQPILDYYRRYEEKLEEKLRSVA
ncbi:hypothetical protein HY643_05075 [Candidatus Woesearchaeota archaeon]|nr:hypothetical protein [Candidatus Woesearchaeota archaeon]